MRKLYSKINKDVVSFYFVAGSETIQDAKNILMDGIIFPSFDKQDIQRNRPNVLVILVNRQLIESIPAIIEGNKILKGVIRKVYRQNYHFGKKLIYENTILPERVQEYTQDPEEQMQKMNKGSKKLLRKLK